MNIGIKSGISSIRVFSVVYDKKQSFLAMCLSAMTDNWLKMKIS